MADRLRAFDWANTPLGPPQQWPQSLRTAIAMCMSSLQPMYVWWGPDLINIYNDAYIPLAGSVKHPQFFGRPAREAWPEIWDSTLLPFVEEVRSTHRAIWREDMLIPVARAGRAEEAYFTFSFAPVYDEQGAFAGIFCACNETTTLHSQQRHFRELVDSSPAILWMTDPSGACTYLSRPWYELTGRTPEQDLGLGWLENVHPDDSARAGEIFLSANANQAPFSFDYRLRRRDGSYRWMLDSGSPRLGADGTYLGYIGNVIDVHDRSVLQARFASVSRAVGLGLWYCDLPFDELIWDDNVKEHFFLPKAARVTIDTFYERIHPDDRARTRAAIEHSIAHHAPYDILYRTTREGDPSALKHIRAIGWTDYDAAGAPIRFDGVTLDVTDERLAHAMAEETQRRYELATRATRNAIWDWDLQTQRVQWNEAINSEYGHPREVMQCDAAWWSEHIHPEDRDRVLQSIHVVVDSAAEQYWSEEYRYRRGDGTFVTVLDRGFIMRDDSGRSVRMFGAMEDITARKVAEEALRSAIRARDEFLSIASHELKTPLTSLKLQLQLLGRSVGDSERTRRATVQTTRQVDRISRLVDDMLDVSRLTTGKLALERANADVGALVEEVVEQFRPQFEESGAALHVRIERPTHVQLDRARIEQVLVNLLSNALKYGNRKPVTVTVGEEAGVATISVADQGMGIGAEHQARVFDRFERAVPASGISGLGLGLFIARYIVEMHGGTITLTSALGSGSTFVVRLPA